MWNQIKPLCYLHELYSYMRSCMLSAVCSLLYAVCCMFSAVCCLLYALCYMPSAVCSLLHTKRYSDDQSKKNDMGGECGMYGGQKFIQGFSGEI
jgi:hypothetical protein